MAKNITFEQLQEFAERADERIDALEGNSPKGRAMTLASGGWTNDSGDANYPYQYKLTVEGVTSASRADAVLDDTSVAVAAACGVCPTTTTAANTVIFKSNTAPTAALTGVLYIRKTATMST